MTNFVEEITAFARVRTLARRTDCTPYFHSYLRITVAHVSRTCETCDIYIRGGTSPCD